MRKDHDRVDTYLRSLSFSLSYGTLEGKLEGMAGIVVARDLAL